MTPNNHRLEPFSLWDVDFQLVDRLPLTLLFIGGRRFGKQGEYLC
jgi:hypothetical protein